MPAVKNTDPPATAPNPALPSVCDYPFMEELLFSGGQYAGYQHGGFPGVAPLLEPKIVYPKNAPQCAVFCDKVPDNHRPVCGVVNLKASMRHTRDAQSVSRYVHPHEPSREDSSQRAAERGERDKKNFRRHKFPALPGFVDCWRFQHIRGPETFNRCRSGRKKAPPKRGRD